MNIDLSRFKNYGLWVAIFAAIPLILKALGLNILPADYDQIVTAILSILVMAGIINNPTTESKWFSDDKNSDGKLIDDGKTEEENKQQ